jgi:hypothetical protein
MKLRPEMPGKPGQAVRTCWLAILLIAGMASCLTGEEIARIEGEHIKRFSFGNLRKLNLKGGNGHYTLNNVELPRVSSNAVELTTADQTVRVKATFLKTVLVSKSHPVNTDNQELLRNWTQKIPLVRNILAEQDSLGSMKPILYDLLEPKDKSDLEWQEELVLLWSADPADDPKIGDTQLWPAMPFPGQAVDVQYRGVKGPAKQLIGKVILQILYIRDQGRPATLGAFVIVSKPSGDYEFYVVPRSLLDQIVISGESSKSTNESAVSFPNLNTGRARC